MQVLIVDDEYLIRNVDKIDWYYTAPSDILTISLDTEALKQADIDRNKLKLSTTYNENNKRECRLVFKRN